MLAHLKLFLLLFIVVAISERINEKDKDAVNQDVPLKNDLHALLESLRRTIKFCHSRKNDINVNLAFGLFLIHVNLRSCLLTNKAVPATLRDELQDILKDNDVLLRHFKQRKLNITDPEEMSTRNISQLFKEMSWVNNLERFRQVQQHNPIFQPESHSGRNDPDWQDYLKRMLTFELWTPHPKMSDYCINSLVKSPKTDKLRCEISDICHNMLRNGTNFGYALTHRLLFLIQARSGRGCNIYSPKTDKRIRLEFCSRAYEEAEYIAVHDFDYIDLLLEQMALCTLDGHSKFLRRSWLHRLLQHQAAGGCFVEQLPDIGECNTHVTGVAAATLGAAVRFIIEMYY